VTVSLSLRIITLSYDKCIWRRRGHASHIRATLLNGSGRGGGNCSQWSNSWISFHYWRHTASPPKLSSMCCMHIFARRRRITANQHRHAPITKVPHGANDTVKSQWCAASLISVHSHVSLSSTKRLTCVSVWRVQRSTPHITRHFRDESFYAIGCRLVNETRT